MTYDLGESLLKGMLIGAGGATPILSNGKIAGIRGILGNRLRGVFGTQAWCHVFLFELILPAAIFGVGAITYEHALPLLAVSGLLVSRMSDPHRVLGVPVVTGDRNTALAFTMAGADGSGPEPICDPELLRSLRLGIPVRRRTCICT